MVLALGGEGPMVAAVLFTELGIAAIMIGLRGYTRYFIRGGLAPDDYALWITLVLQCGFAVMMLVSCLYGFGQHNVDLDKYNVMMATKMELVAQFMVALSMGSSKASVALLLLRIMNVPWNKWILWFWIISMNFLTILMAITVYAQCYPVQSLWDTDVAVEACPISLTEIATVACAWSAAMDFFLAFFPWYVIWGLNMKTKDKITICVSLSLGIIAGICGVIRTTGLEAISNSADYLHATAESIMWTSSEQTISIICVSVPSLRPLWQRLRGQGSSTDDYMQGGYGTGGGTRSFGAQKLASVSADKSHSHSMPVRDEELGSDDYPMQPMQHQTQISSERAGTHWQEADDNSDKSILGAGIVRKQEISVTYATAQ